MVVAEVEVIAALNVVDTPTVQVGALDRGSLNS